MKDQRNSMMNAHVGPVQALNFRARSLLAFVIEPTLPLVEWFATLDAWLARSTTFFVAKPVILEMAGLDIGLTEFRDLLGGLARRNIRVMAVENPSNTLVGPHLPPAVKGLPVKTPTLPGDNRVPEIEPARTEKTTSLIIDANVRSGQSIVHPEGDVTIVGRVASGAEVIAGGSVHVYGALQGRVIAGILGLPGARIFCREARAELLCIGGAHITAEDIDPKLEGCSLDVRLDDGELKIRILN